RPREQAVLHAPVEEAAAERAAPDPSAVPELVGPQEGRADPAASRARPEHARRLLADQGPPDPHPPFPVLAARQDREGVECCPPERVPRPGPSIEAGAKPGTVVGRDPERAQAAAHE